MNVLRMMQKYFKPISNTPMLGRWSLKHRCQSEDIVVFNANRDNCGDNVCGKSDEYHKTFEEIKSKKI